jgi:hypothetical protein
MKIKYVLPVVFAATSLLSFHGAFAQNGPNVQTLVQISEEYDLAGKRQVTQSNVLDRIGKNTHYRTIYEVTEKAKLPAALKKAYVVEESVPVPTTVMKANLYKVEKAIVQEAQNKDVWTYEQR